MQVGTWTGEFSKRVEGKLAPYYTEKDECNGL